MLSAESNLVHFVLLVHLRVDIVRRALVVVLQRAEHVVLAETPRVNLVSLALDTVRVLAACGYMTDLFLAHLCFVTFLELKLPEVCDCVRTIEITNVFQLVVFWLLFFFFDLAGATLLGSLLSGFLGYRSLFRLLLFSRCVDSVLFGFALSFRLSLSLSSLLKLLLLAVLTVEVAEANLALVVPTEAVDDSITCMCNSVMLTSGNADDIVALVRVQIANARGSSRVQSVAEAELTVVVHAP